MSSLFFVAAVITTFLYFYAVAELVWKVSPYPDKQPNFWGWVIIFGATIIYTMVFIIIMCWMGR